MNAQIEEVLRTMLTNIQVLNAELERLARNEQITDSLVSVRLLRDITAAYTAGAKLMKRIVPGAK